MKKISIILTCGLFAASLVSCQEKVEPETPASEETVTELTLRCDESLLDQYVRYNASQAGIIVFAAPDFWSAAIEPDVDWLWLERYNGEDGKNVLRIHLSPNMGAEERSADVVVSCIGQSFCCHITQQSYSAATALPWITDALKADMIYSVGRLRTTTSVMQSFDLDPVTNRIYYTQLNSEYKVYVSWGAPNNKEKVEGTMELLYSGHGSNFTIERDGAKRYIWITNYASKNSSGEYWDGQVISRIPIENGKIYKPWDAADNYYFGEKNISVAVDFESDRLTVLGISTGRCRTYSLSAIQALPVEDITLEEIKYGGGTSSDVETRWTPVVKARNCTRINPVGDFKIVRVSGISWQGFEVSGDLIYQAQGNGNNNDGKDYSHGYLLIYKLDGTVVMDRTQIEALKDLSSLNSMGLTDTGYMEPEGVKIRDGVMYLGYASKDSKGVRMGTILKYATSAK